MRQTKKRRLTERTRSGRGAEAVRVRAIEAFFLHIFAQIHLMAMAARRKKYRGFSVTKLGILGGASLTPGLTVGELVRFMRLTHQAINEPLRDLISEGYIVAKIGLKDRRQRRLFATRKGSQLHIGRIRWLAKNFEDAFRATGPGAAAGVLEVYRRLILPSDREFIARALPLVVSGVSGD